MDRPIASQVIRNKRIKLVLVPLVTITLLFFGVKLAVNLLKPKLIRTQFRTARVERGPIAATLQASGILLPETESVLTSPFESRVLEILKYPGSSVAEGEAILRLDMATQEIERDKLDEQLALKENEKRQSRLELEKQHKQNRGKWELANLELQFMEAQFQQKKTLSEQGLISSEELLQAKLNVDKKRIERRQLDEALEDARASASATLAGIDLEIRILQKSKQELSRQLMRATTNSDRNGILTWVVPEEGATVGKGDLIAKIADVRSFKVEGSISDFHAARIVPKSPATVDINGVLIPGTVDKLLPAVEDGILKFEVSLTQQPQNQPRSNMRVEVHLVTQQKSQSLIVKKGPAINGAGIQPLFVIRGDRAHRVMAEIGLSGIEAYEILSGLEEGDEIILSDMEAFAHMEEVPIQ